MKEITDLLRNTNSKLIRSVLDSGGVIIGTKIENFRGVLVNDREFSNSLAKKLESMVGIKGYISTDELPRYGISKQEKSQIESAFGAGENDVVVFVADRRDKCEKAIEIIEREIAGYRSKK